MRKKDAEKNWQNISEEALSGIKEWRQTHPKATLQEIEQAIDDRLNRLRSRMVQDVVQESEAADWTGPHDEQAPLCPKCGGSLRKRGKREKQLQSSRGSLIDLTRQFASCSRCGYSFFPPGS